LSTDRGDFGVGFFLIARASKRFSLIWRSQSILLPSLMAVCSHNSDGEAEAREEGGEFHSPSQWNRVATNQKASIPNHASAKIPAARTSRGVIGTPENTL
jgi:hypothetical protein